MFFNQKIFRKTSGFSLVELIIAIAVFGLLAPALITLLANFYSASWGGGQRATAQGLAQEGIEAVRSIRRQAWNKLIAGQSGVQNYSGFWDFSTTTEDLLGSEHQYTRTITIIDVYRDSGGQIAESAAPGATLDLHTKKISSQISWQTNLSLNTEIKLIAYLTNWQSRDWRQTDWFAGPGQLIWSDPAGYFSDDGNIDYSTAGEIKLKKQTGGIFWGNQFLLSAVSGIGQMRRDNYQTSLRFTAQTTQNVKAIRIYLAEKNGASPTYRFGLQADNGSGLPSGNWLGSSGNGYGDLAPISVGWQTIDLNENVNLLAGQIYHLVVVYQSGTVNNSRSIGLQRSSPLNNLIPFNQAIDSAANTLFYNGRRWTVQNYQPIYELDFTDGTFEGNPYENSQVAVIYGSNFFGEDFMLPQNATTTQVSFYTRKNHQNTTGDLLVTLWDVTSNTLLEQGILATPSQAGTSFSWITFNFITPRKLEGGRNYRIYLSSTATGANRAYEIYQLYNNNSANYNSINFDGINSFYNSSSDSGGSWISNQAADISGFRLKLQGASQNYATEGWLESSAFNTGSLSSFNILSWIESLPTSVEDIWVQLATAPDAAGSPGVWTDWQGLTGPDSYYQSSQETLIPETNGHNNQTWVKYRVILKGNGSDTPVLNEIKINYTP